jgi:glycine oxidase
MSDVLIVGGGAAGCLTAIKLAQQGASVTLVERGALGMESTWAGGGILFPLLPWNYREEVNQLALAGARLYPALAESLRQTTCIDPEYTISGMLVLPGTAAATDFAPALAWCEQHQLRAELRDHQLWLPDVAQARNSRLVKALRRALELHQVTIREQTEIARLVVQADRVSALETSRGELLQADQVVITAGAWSKNLLGQHAPAVELKPMRGQMLLYQLPAGTLGHIMFRDDFYLIPRRDGHILAGSTVEDVGFDKSTTPQAAADLQRKAAECLPQLRHATPIKHWSGLRPGSPDNIPLIGRHATLQNLWLNTGHFRYGVTMAPASAEILVGLMQQSAA